MRQVPVDPLGPGDLFHARLSLARTQEGQSVIQVLSSRTRVEIKRFPENLDSLSRGARRFV